LFFFASPKTALNCVGIKLSAWLAICTKLTAMTESMRIDAATGFRSEGKNSSHPDSNFCSQGSMYDTAPSKIHRVDKIRIEFYLRRDDESCLQGQVSCPTDLDGGCCPSGYSCGARDYSAVTTTSTCVRCGSLTGYYDCLVSNGAGSRCPIGFICRESNESLPIASSSPLTQPVTGITTIIPMVTVQPQLTNLRDSGSDGDRLSGGAIYRIADGIVGFILTIGYMVRLILRRLNSLLSFVKARPEQPRRNSGDGELQRVQMNRVNMFQQKAPLEMWGPRSQGQFSHQTSELELGEGKKTRESQ
ncbi:hypothetical protein F4809DRAFT_621668, partial [Biscogniauxia mediterranea]